MNLMIHESAPASDHEVAGVPPSGSGFRILEGGGLRRWRHHRFCRHRHIVGASTTKDSAPSVRAGRASASMLRASMPPRRATTRSSVQKSSPLAREKWEGGRAKLSQPQGTRMGIHSCRFGGPQHWHWHVRAGHGEGCRAQGEDRHVQAVAELDRKIKGNQGNIYRFKKLQFTLIFFQKKRVHFFYVFLWFSTRIWFNFILNLYHK